MEYLKNNVFSILFPLKLHWTVVFRLYHPPFTCSTIIFVPILITVRIIDPPPSLVAVTLNFCNVVPASRVIVKAFLFTFWHNLKHFIILPVIWSYNLWLRYTVVFNIIANIEWPNSGSVCAQNDYCKITTIVDQIR